jgi:thiamine kinase-like enzyme
METYEFIINEHIQNRIGESKNYTYELEKLYGLTNEIFLLKIFEKNRGILKERCIFRKFGNFSIMSDIVDRILESKIIKKLSDEGLTPGIISTDMKNYRFEIYIDDCFLINKEYARSEKFLDKLIDILIFYSTLSYIHFYKINLNSKIPNLEINISDLYIADFSSFKISVDHNIFDLCMTKLIAKGKEKFEVFSQNFTKHFDSEECLFSYLYKDLSHKNILDNFEKISYYVKNFQEILLKVFPKDGLLILNHNDIHKLNILTCEERDKIIILDHEFATLNLIGADFINFLIEMNYDYSVKVFPFYEYTPDLINLPNYHKLFLKYVDRLIEKQANLNSNKFFDEFVRNLEEIKTYEYFLNLLRFISLYWLIICAIKINYDNFHHRQKFDYFKHAIDRIALFEATYDYKVCVENVFNN